MNVKNIHLQDTLGILSPFTVVYITVDPDFVQLMNYKKYKVFDTTIVPKYYKRFPDGGSQISRYLKVQLKKNLTCFEHKADVSFSPDDSLLIKRQVSIIEQTLKHNLVQLLPMPDSLYLCFKKYGYKQYLITDAIEYFYAKMVEANIISYYRFFIFDMSTKSLSFYDFQLGGCTLSPRILSENPPNYTDSRIYDLFYLKDYNKRIKQSYKRSLKEKK